MIRLSTLENPSQWCGKPGDGVIEFFSPADAKRAEVLFNRLSIERDMLHTGLIAAVQVMEHIATEAIHARNWHWREKVVHHDIPAAREILAKLEMKG